MTNIWGFLNQTLYVSSMALLIMGLKILLKDKLSARWQYGVWSVLIFCLFIPVGSVGGYIIPQLHICVEAIKTYVEAGLSSVYSSSSVAVYNSHILPVITVKPSSITDMFFVVYIAGIVFCLARYFIGYFRLKKIISASAQADENTRNYVYDIAVKYGLDSCPVKIIPGLPSAFVFGLMHQILVLPEDEPTDEKVILHELIHLKNGDLWQNVFWSGVKALHWPNPFLQFVFKTIHNDMESLCDFRVMELLEGEERREYGRILLSMTNEKYPSAFGTTSISNGGHFIAERIQAIARFKKYPQGMGVVSVCIVAMLLPLMVTGSNMKNFSQGSYNNNSDTFVYRYQHARAKITNCRTVAGAIDTYAKAVLTGNELYYLAVNPNKVNVQKYHLPEKIDVEGQRDLYYVVDLEKINSKTYVANLLFKDYRTNLEDPSGRYKSGGSNITVPIKIIKENGWKVYQTGDSVSNLSIALSGNADYTTIAVDDYPIGDRYEYTTPQGTTDIIVHKVYVVSNYTMENNFMFSNIVHNLIPAPHTQFSDGYYAVDIEYKPVDKENTAKVSISATTLSKMSESGRSGSGGGEGGHSSGTHNRSVYRNINIEKRKALTEDIVSDENLMFTQKQKEAVIDINSRTEINFGQLKLTKDNFKSVSRVKGLHIRVNENGKNVCNRKINLKEGKLYDQNI